MSDPKIEEAKEKLLKLSELWGFTRKSLRMSFGLNPEAPRERILQSLEAWRQQTQKSNILRQQQVGEEQRPIIQRQSIFVRPLQLLQQRLQIQPENEEEAKIQEFLEEKRKKELLEELKKAEQAKKRGGRKTKERGKFRKGKIADGGYNMTRGRFVVTEESPPLGPKQGQTR